MIIDSESKEAIALAVEAGLSFACYALPGETAVRFQADPRVDGVTEAAGAPVFVVGKWLQPYRDRIEIRDIWDATRAAQQCRAMLAAGNRFSPSPVEFEPLGETRDHYLSAVGEIIANCRRRAGKTVFSRVIEGRCGGLDIASVAERLFSEFPATFRHVYYTPETGLWIGATPELLLSYDDESARLRTVAFAGTRISLPRTPLAVTASGEEWLDADGWDDKNLREHRFVLDYITDALSSLGLDCEVSEPMSVRYGKIEHLCHRISAPASPEIVEKALDLINPTPALCGFPKEDAIADIARGEAHPRDCYGGFVGVADSGSFRAYVNLRCAAVAGETFRIYGGGGITGDSCAEEEYAETVSKTAKLRELFGDVELND